ncbi:MAG: TIGR03067 domain-containing protein [Gemmataceae bacterium]|nr:TIGR03067 domain-containing protein [Gemmataceae bacterium]
MYSTLLIGLALSVGAPAGKEAPKKEAPSIVGEWHGEKAVGGGKERPVPSGGIVFTFSADGMFKVKEGANEKPDTAKYKIDAKKSPAEIDMEAGAKGSILGIFKIDGDTLTICITGGKDGERPTKFESLEGSRTMLMTFKRAKK